MEVKFIENTLQCMRPALGQVHTGEQTQEIRLPDAYPDIGKILDCWGQVLIRGKEWRTGSVGANGGVMCWVLYAPEDGTPPRVVDTWIPIGCRWELPDDEEDGVIHLRSVLTELDARGLSARKMMVRASVDTYGAAFTRQTVPVAVAPELPEDVQIKTSNYPAELPMEAGEKQLQLDESFNLPGNLPPIHKIVHYSLKPAVAEQKVLGNRLVFRGQTGVELTYLTEEGSLHHWHGEFPFSQYTELDRDYSPYATAWVSPVLTAMEMELSEGQLHLQGGMAAQYIIYDRTTVELVEDAYSPNRDMELKMSQLELPMLLDRTVMEIPFVGSLSTDAEKVISATAYPEYPSVTMDENLSISLNGQFRTLSQNSEGQLYGESARFDSSMPLNSAPENQHFLWMGDAAQTEISPNGDGFSLKGCYPIVAQIYSGLPMPMVTELELGEMKQPDADRPSIILRRAGEEGLWGLAKNCGSTVAAIKEANKLTAEPEAGQLLLIPIS